MKIVQEKIVSYVLINAQVLVKVQQLVTLKINLNFKLDE